MGAKSRTIGRASTPTVWWVVEFQCGWTHRQKRLGRRFEMKLLELGQRCSNTFRGAALGANPARPARGGSQMAQIDQMAVRTEQKER